MSRVDLREELTRKIVDLLEKGDTPPWRKPWKGVPSLPYNALTGQAYRGVNRMWLGLAGHSDPRWLTFRQVHALSQQTKTPLHVRKGEKGTPIEKWLFDREEPRVVPETGRTETVTVPRTRPVALTFTVFNADQIEGMPPAPRIEKEVFGPSDVLTRHIVDLLGARVFPDGGDRAYYRTGDDTIHLPVRSAFESSAGYDSTLLHELVHWTGHESRLGAVFGSFGSEKYAFEELRAEIGSYYLNGTLGLSNDLRNHASYVEDWLSLLKKDKHALPRALRAAGLAEEFVVGAVLEKEREPGIGKRLGTHLERLGTSGFYDRKDSPETTREREGPDERENALKIGSPGIEEMPFSERFQVIVVRPGKTAGPARDDRPTPAVSVGARMVREERKTTDSGPATFYTCEEMAPPDRRFDGNTPGVFDGGRKYRAVTTDPRFADLCNRLGPHEETRNGFLTPHGWRVLRGHYPKEIRREFFPEEFANVRDPGDRKGMSGGSREERRPPEGPARSPEERGSAAPGKESQGRERFRDDGRGR